MWRSSSSQLPKQFPVTAMENAEKYWFKNLMRVLNLGIRKQERQQERFSIVLISSVSWFQHFFFLFFLRLKKQTKKTHYFYGFHFYWPRKYLLATSGPEISIFHHLECAVLSFWFKYWYLNLFLCRYFTSHLLYFVLFVFKINIFKLCNTSQGPILFKE